MWKPRFLSFFFLGVGLLCVAGLVATINWIDDWDAPLPRQDTAYLVSFMTAIVIGFLGTMFGVGGVINSWALRRTGSTTYIRMENSLGWHFVHPQLPPNQGYCETSAVTAIKFFTFLFYVATYVTCAILIKEWFQLGFLFYSIPVLGAVFALMIGYKATMHMQKLKGEKPNLFNAASASWGFGILLLALFCGAAQVGMHKTELYVLMKEPQTWYWLAMMMFASLAVGALFFGLDRLGNSEEFRTWCPKHKPQE